MKMKSVWLSIMAVCLFFSLTSISSATPELRITSGVNSHTFTGIGNFVQASIDPGDYGFNWYVDLFAASNPNYVEMNLLGSVVGGGAPLMIEVSDSFVTNGAEFLLDLGLDFLSAQEFPNSTVDYAVYIDPTNQLFGKTQPPVYSTTQSGNFYGIDSVLVTPGALFTMTQMVTIHNPFWMQTTLNDVSASNNPVPEPSSLILLGSGLMGAFFFTRKRK